MKEGEIMNLILCDMNTCLCNEWRKYFNNICNVTIIDNCVDLESMKYDCVVSPANSFGFMDGGFDGILLDYFGYELMKRVQDKIRTEYAGEQPVGTCLIVETGNKQHPYLAHTPTMRIPRIIKEYDTVYNAMRAMLLAVQKQGNIKTVLCTGLGTSTGRVPAYVAAKQMYLAYKSVFSPPKQINWRTAIEIETDILNSNMIL